jgi:hypothetical protein
LTIAVTTPTNTAPGVALEISGTYETVGINDQIPVLTGADKGIFTNFDAHDGTFSATLSDDTESKIYILQLAINNVVSNPIPFIAGYNNTGTN